MRSSECKTIRGGSWRLAVLGAIVIALAPPACAKELTREQAKIILDKRLAERGAMTRDLPLGPGMHIGLTSAGDFGAPIRSDILAVYRVMESRGLVSLVDRGTLQGWGDAVRTFDGSLTAEGAKKFGELKRGRADYSSASAYPLPPTYLTILICNRAVKEITGIRIVKPDVEVEVEYAWTCESASDLGELLSKTRKDFMPTNTPTQPSGNGSVRMALYDDGWRLSDAR